MYQYMVSRERTVSGSTDRTVGFLDGEGEGHPLGGKGKYRNGLQYS